MRFFEKTDCNLPVSKWQCQHLQSKKHLSTFVTFSADSSCCSWMLWNLL